jgi:uncharacterized protein (DUF2062 family)
MPRKANSRVIKMKLLRLSSTIKMMALAGEIGFHFMAYFPKFGDARGVRKDQ